LCRTGCAGGAEGCEALTGTTIVSISIWGQMAYEPTNRKPSALTGKSTSPGEDSTGAGAERESGFDPNRRPSSRRASTKEQGKYTPPSRGVARGVAKDPTDDPAELDVLF
jgi:hypothetical protein